MKNSLSFSPGNTWVPLLINYNAAPWTWESAYEGGKIVEKKKIGDDERIIAYYIPYSVDKKRWGIYIKKGEVMQEIKFLDKEFKASFGMAYLSLLLLHELTHHVIEDWRVSTDGVFTYNKEDENLCEYTAFTLTEAIIDKFNIVYLHPNLIVGEDKEFPNEIICHMFTLGDKFCTLGITLPGFINREIIDIIWEELEYIIDKLPREVSNCPIKNQEKLSILYYYLGRDKNYSPKVPFWVREEEFKNFLAQNLTVGLDNLWDKESLDSVYSRIFIV